MFFDTVDWATSKPSINNSPWILEATSQGQFSAALRASATSSANRLEIRSDASAETGGATPGFWTTAATLLATAVTFVAVATGAELLDGVDNLDQRLRRQFSWSYSDLLLSFSTESDNKRQILI